MTNTYYFILVIVAVCLGLMWMIVHSPFGKTLQAIRENPGRTEFIAIHVRRYQLAVFVISSIFLGIAGSLFCVFSGSVFPDYAHWAKSTDMLVICLLGGFYQFPGPIVGSVIYIVLSKIISKYTMFWMFFLGVIIVLLVLYLRNGIMGGKGHGQRSVSAQHASLQNWRQADLCGACRWRSRLAQRSRPTRSKAAAVAGWHP